MKYYYYRIDTGEYMGYNAHINPNYDDTVLAYTNIQPPERAFDFDLGNTQQAYWLGTEWEIREV